VRCAFDSWIARREKPFAAGGDRSPEPSERRERDLEALALLADQMVVGHLDIVQDHVADRVRREDLEALDLDPAALRRDVEHREALGLPDLPRRAREHGEEIRDADVRDERLAAGEEPSVAAVRRARRDVPEARSGAGLGDREGGDAPPARDERKDLLAERGGTRARDRVGAEPLQDEDDVEHPRVPGELVAHRAERADADLGIGREGIRLRAAVALGHGPRDEAGLREDDERGTRAGGLVEAVHARAGLLPDVVREHRERTEYRFRTGARHRFSGRARVIASRTGARHRFGAFAPGAGREASDPEAGRRRGFFAKSAGRFSTNARCASP
jgi:hypothetical protein